MNIDDQQQVLLFHRSEWLGELNWFSHGGCLCGDDSLADDVVSWRGVWRLVADPGLLPNLNRMGWLLRCLGRPFTAFPGTPWLGMSVSGTLPSKLFFSSSPLFYRVLSTSSL